MAEMADTDQEEFCYICFEGPSSGEGLEKVCKCPTRVHRKCVARWQLYSAGRKEEKTCRFCQDTLPDWKQVLTPAALPPAVPVLSIYYNNTCCRMKVRPGPDGLQAFLRQLEVIVGRDVAHVNFVFRCRCPDTGAEIFLQGLQAFEAAMHCACVRAAQRSLQQQQQQLLLQQQQQAQLPPPQQQQPRLQQHVQGQTPRPLPSTQPLQQPQPLQQSQPQQQQQQQPGERHGLGPQAAPAPNQHGHQHCAAVCGRLPIRRAASAPQLLLRGGRSHEHHVRGGRHPVLPRLIAPTTRAAPQTGAVATDADSRAATSGVAACGTRAGSQPAPQSMRCDGVPAAAVVKSGSGAAAPRALPPAANATSCATTAGGSNSRSSSVVQSGTSSARCGISDSNSVAACHGVMRMSVPSHTNSSAFPSAAAAAAAATAGATSAAAAAANEVEAAACSAQRAMPVPITTSVLCSTGLIDEGALGMPTADGASVAIADSLCFAPPPLAADGSSSGGVAGGCKTAAAALHSSPPVLASAPPAARNRTTSSSTSGRRGPGAGLSATAPPSAGRRLGYVLGPLSAPLAAAQPGSAAAAAPTMAASAASDNNTRAVAAAGSMSDAAPEVAAVAVVGGRSAAAAGGKPKGGAKLLSSFMSLGGLRALFHKKHTSTSSAPRAHA